MTGGRRRTGLDERLRGLAPGLELAPLLAPVSPWAARGADALMRVLILSWEYPPLIEGGLARHVRKLSENLVCQGVDVHVLTRGREESPAEEVVEGVYAAPRARAAAARPSWASSSPGSST